MSSNTMLLLPYLQAYFMAYGPAFKQQHEVPPFENIELYNLMACMLIQLLLCVTKGCHE
jgi:hypothetical protein